MSVRRLLREDRVVKFGGETRPDYGWCVLITGGSGSGKGYVQGKGGCIDIRGRVYNVDDIKDFVQDYRKDIDSEFGGNWIKVPKDSQKEDGKYLDQSAHEKHLNATNNPIVKIPKGDGWTEVNLDKATVDMGDGNGEVPVGKPYDYSNPRYVSFLHQELGDFSHKLKNSILDNDTNNKDRLPNVIFDMTGKKRMSIEPIVSKMSGLGYKVAIVWVLVSIPTAIKNNQDRKDKGGRGVDDSMLVNIHKGVQRTMSDIASLIYDDNYMSSEILEDPAIFHAVDEFWVVVNEREKDFSNKYIDIKDNGTNDKYNNPYKSGVDSSGKMLNCYRITSLDDFIKVFNNYLGESMSNSFSDTHYMKVVREKFDRCKATMLNNGLLRNK